MFKGLQDINRFSNSDTIDINIKYWLDFSFLEVGAYTNVYLNTSGNYGGDYSRLIPVKDYFHSDGTVWKTFHPNLVWESGISYSGTQPISISGVYVDNVLTDATIDYVNGRVIFDSGISTSSVVKMEYSYKWVNIYSSTEVDWFGDLQRDTFRPDRQNYSNNSGDYQYNRVQLPAIVYSINERTYRPYQIGLGQWGEFSLLFDVLSNDQNWVLRLADTLSEQKYKTFLLFDANKVSDSGVFPLTSSGTLSSTPLTYDNLINDGYYWNKMTIADSHQGKPQKLKNSLYHLPVKLKTEIILTDI